MAVVLFSLFPSVFQKKLEAAHLQTPLLGFGKCGKKLTSAACYDIASLSSILPSCPYFWLLSNNLSVGHKLHIL